MEVVIGRDGKRYSWEPTTDLLCSYCRASFDVVPRTLGQVNFTFNYILPDPLERGEYWYLHKRCAHIEDGLDVIWGWLSLYPVLGKGFFGQGKSQRIQNELRQRMPVGAYDRLYEQWLPALQIKPVKKVLQRRAPKISTPKAPTLVHALKPTKALTPKRLPTQARARSWITLRFTIMQRDGFRCLLCGVAAKDDPDVRLEVDHIIPRSRGGTNDPENLWTLCHACNRGKGTHDL